jgi:hypothetical protein
MTDTVSTYYSFTIRVYCNTSVIKTYLSVKHATGANNILKNMFANMAIYCTKGVIQKINVCVVVDGSSKGNSLFLTSTKVNTLKCKQNAQLQTLHN